jgi:cobalamin biosynthesis protein CobD/CbiB
MRTDRELAQEVLRRTETLRREKQKRSGRLYGILAATVCVVVVVGLSFALSAVMPNDVPVPGWQGAVSATLLLGAAAGGYALIGVIGFTLGVAVTLLCLWLRNRER